MSKVTKEEVAGWFSISVDELNGARILYAYYSYEDYSGEAFVLLEKNGKLYEVNGSHCSCYGLEDQWGLEETLVEAIQKRLDSGYGFYYGEKDEIAKALKNWTQTVARRARAKTRK